MFTFSPRAFARGFLLLSVLACGPWAAGRVWAGELDLFGSTIGQPTFARPEPDGTPAGALANSVPFRVLRFTLSDYGSAQCYVLTQDNGYDPYLHLYLGAFDPSQPAMNLLDAAGNTGQNVTLDVPDRLVDTTYLLVINGFQNDDTGTFDVRVETQGSVHGGFVSVPEPGAGCLLGVGAVGLMLTVAGRRRFRSSAGRLGAQC